MVTTFHDLFVFTADYSSPEFRRRFRQHALEKPFFLNVGVLDRRKNVRRLVEAFERIPSNCLLVLVGGVGYGSEEILEKIHASLARPRIRVLGHASRDYLARLYRTASALVFPSLDEGFGMPVLEAMTASLPVVTSNRSALPEVAGDAALLVDPEQADDIQQALERIVSESDLRSRLYLSQSRSSR
jgi:alpha-1,3-rhamnosyl/mannosyltransferase